MKNILIVFVSLFGIMLVSTLIVMSFNSLIGFNTDVNNEHTSTVIAAVAFTIAVIWKFFYDRIHSSKTNRD